MADRIRWGILSTARIGRARVIPAIQKARNSVVVAVASRDLERARAFAREMNIPTAHGSYEELLADPNIDAIYNPLPNSEHAPWSIKCAEAGKATLCEKPLASNAMEAQAMVDAFARHSVPLAEAFMYRFHPQTRRVQAMVAEGAVGEINIIQASFTFDIANRENDIRIKRALAGGALMDVGCYCVNVMRLMTGEEPVEARAFASMGLEVDETLAGLLRFPSGALGHFDCGFHTVITNAYEIRGRRGRIVVDPAFIPSATQDTTIRYYHDRICEEIVIPAADQYQYMVEDFADALLNNRPPLFPPEDAVRNMAAIDLLYAALPGH